MDGAALDHGSNISGLSLLLNVEKISNAVDIDDVERRVKNMYIQNGPEVASSVRDDDDDANLIEEYEHAMEEIESVMGGGEVAVHRAMGGYTGGGGDAARDAPEESEGGVEDEEEDDDEEEDGDEEGGGTHPSYQQSGRHPFLADPQDSLYMQKTRDDHLQTSISRVMEGVPNMNIDLEQEIESERKLSLLEQIEALRDDLAELGVSVEGMQYQVEFDAPLKRVEEVHRRLTFKYQKLKYNSIAEEALVASASLLEMIFNGKHEYFGCRPDITGYSDVVKSKLKRIRVETSTAVSRFVSKNNVGVMPRLMMELLPSLITQSQRRKLQMGDSLNENIVSKKSSIRGHISDLNNMLPG